MDEIIVGTYEGFLLGYTISNENEVVKLKQTFATQSHTASVRCASIAGKFLASGGTDDKVVVIDMKTRTEHTVLMNHDGTVNSVAFTNNGTHLVTGSDDGTIIVTRVGNWQIEKVWKKAHNGLPVTAIAVHPSDKLALSIGGDKTLRTWNLVKGRPAFTINLSSKGITQPSEIKFSPGGDRFSLISQQSVDIWTISKAGIEKRITCNSKPACVHWVDDEKLFVGLDNGNIISFTIADTQANTYVAHKERVKCLYFVNSTLYSASSAGQIKVWSVSDNKVQELCSTNAGCRVTCVTLNNQSRFIKKEVEKEGIEENVSDKQENDKSDSDESVEIKENEKEVEKVPGAFVSISYDAENVQKKGKKRKRNRNSNNNKKFLNKKSKKINET